MNTLGMMLAAAAGPLAKRVLAALGIGLVSFVGVDLALTALLNQAQAAWATGLPAVMVYMSIAGVNKALAIIAGAMTARLALLSLKRLTLL